MNLAASPLSTALFLCIAVTAAPPDGAAARASAKFDLIDSGRAKRGSVIAFTESELNAWARERVPQHADGVRDARVTLGAGTATVSAQVDFIKLRAAAGHETNAAIAKLLDGERPVRVSARLDSADGRATVYLTRVEIGGVAITGSVLDFLVNTVFRPMFPEAHIDEPFALRGNIERIEIQDGGVRVAIRKR